MTIQLRHIAVLPIGLSVLLSVHSATGQDADPPTRAPAESQPSQPSASSVGPGFTHVLEVYTRDLETISSDQEALTFFTTRLAVPLQLSEAAAVLRAGPRATATLPGVAIGDLESAAVRLTAMLALWHMAQSVRGSDGSLESPVAPEYMDSHRTQLQWIGGREEATMLPRLLSLLEAQGWARSIPGADVEHPTYDAYRAAVDRAYPETTGAEEAWMPAVERDGSAVLRQRLISEVVGAPVPESIRTQMAARYVRQRLRSLMEARIQAIAAELEREAVVTAHHDWLTLNSLRERVRMATGLARLCGSWQWTIHNHRNHGDHKSALVFAPPGEELAGAVKPKEIVALGDLVYLRWELPGGVVQEDSLLFTAEGKRLEGSFVNSAGSWGNITGKRLKSCKGVPEASRPKEGSAPSRSRSKR